MITKDEIESKSQEFEIHSSNVERDYVFGWLIFGIFTASNLKDTIFLKGGNALRKGYFKNTRFSSDLDFGIPGDIAQNVLLEEINKVCDFIQEKAGVVFVKADHIKLRISMDITRFDKVLLPIQTVDLIHPYSDAANVSCKIRCMKLEEIGRASCRERV